MLARHELDETSLKILSAADYIEKHGHTKFKRKDDEGRVCALGAFDWTNDGNKDPAIARIAAHIPHSPWDGYNSPPLPNGEYESPSHKLAQWNNQPERTAEEVIAKFREVAYDPQYAKVTA
jgi:hypothetical protein